MTTCQGMEPGEERRFAWNMTENAGRLSIGAVGSTEHSEVGSIDGPYGDGKGGQRLVLHAYHPIIRYSERVELAGNSNHLEGILLAGAMQGGPMIAKGVTAACATVFRLRVHRRER